MPLATVLLGLIAGFGVDYARLAFVLSVTSYASLLPLAQPNHMPLIIVSNSLMSYMSWRAYRYIHVSNTLKVSELLSLRLSGAESMYVRVLTALFFAYPFLEWIPLRAFCALGLLYCFALLYIKLLVERQNSA